MVGTLEGLEAKYVCTEVVVGWYRGWPRAFERLYQWGYDVDVVVGNGETNIGAGAYPHPPLYKKTQRKK